MIIVEIIIIIILIIIIINNNIHDNRRNNNICFRPPSRSSGEKVKRRGSLIWHAENSSSHVVSVESCFFPPETGTMNPHYEEFGGEHQAQTVSFRARRVSPETCSGVLARVVALQDEECS